MNSGSAKFSLLRKIGLHPLSAFIAIFVDFMLFGPEVASPPSIIITFIFGFLITIPVFLFQKYGSSDKTKIAIAKALLIGILTAIPSPLPSILTGLGALLGLIGEAFQKEEARENLKIYKNPNENDSIDIKAEEIDKK